MESLRKFWGVNVTGADPFVMEGALRSPGGEIVLPESTEHFLDHSLVFLFRFREDENIVQIYDYGDVQHETT